MNPSGPIHIRARTSSDVGRPPVSDSARHTPGSSATTGGDDQLGGQELRRHQPIERRLAGLHRARHRGERAVDGALSIRRLQNGLIASPDGVWISTWACGTDPSEFPESPIHPIT